MLLPGCQCCGTTPSRYVVAARGWTVPYLFRRIADGDGYNYMLPSMSSDEGTGTGTIGADDTTWQDAGWFWVQWAPVDTSRTSTTGNWTGTGGSEKVYVHVKWDGTYQWIRMRDDVYSSTTGFEAVFRRAVGSATTGSNVTGRVIFTASDIYSLQIEGVSSSDYSGVGDLCYAASASAPTDFGDKTLDITFASGVPSNPWALQTQYYSVESLIGQTFSLTLGTVTSPPYTTDFPILTATHGDCYEDTRTAGSYGRGCKVGVVTDGFNVSIIGAGSRTGGGRSTIVYGCSDRVFGNPAQLRTSAGLVVQFDAHWFDAFAVSGSAGTGLLAPWKTKTTIDGGPNANTGWNSWWGSGGSLTIAVS
jgi:hypothetical protein